MSLVPFTGTGGIKEWLGIDDADTSQDAILTPIHETVEELIEDFCECKFSPIPVLNELHDGVRSDTLIPINFPLVSVEELRLGVLVDGTGGSVVDASDYALTDWGIILQHGMFPKGRAQIGLDYTHGHSVVPKTILQAIRLGVEAFNRRHNKKTLGLSSVKSRSKDRESTSLGSRGNDVSGGSWDSKTGLPSEIVAMIAKYRFLEFPGGNTATRNQ